MRKKLNDYAPIPMSRLKTSHIPRRVVLKKAEDLSQLEKSNDFGGHFEKPEIGKDISISIDFANREDNSALSIHAWMNNWMQLIADANKDKLDTIESLFEFGNDEKANEINLYLKKPISELTEEERERVVAVARECFHANDEQLKKLGLLC